MRGMKSPCNDFTYVEIRIFWSGGHMGCRAATWDVGRPHGMSGGHMGPPFGRAATWGRPYGVTETAHAIRVRIRIGSFFCIGNVRVCSIDLYVATRYHQHLPPQPKLQCACCSSHIRYCTCDCPKKCTVIIYCCIVAIS